MQKMAHFCLVSPAWTGSQCYPSQWGGDPQADWEGFAASIEGTVMGNVGVGRFYAS